jgi:hypothetical protein
MAKAKNPKYTTAKAIASYPYFNKPDEFKGATRYKASLIMDREEAAPLMDKCEKVLKDFVESHNEAVKNGDKKGKKINLKKALLNMPFEDHETDDDKVVFRVKQNAEVNGEKVRLIIYDAKGTRLKKAPIIRGGSVVKVAGTIRAYDGLGGGVTLSISAVQIIELSEGGAGDVDADNFGFGEEEGFAADDNDFQDETDDEDFEDEDEDDDDDEDF